jgi:hypothetical protein
MYMGASSIGVLEAAADRAKICEHYRWKKFGQRQLQKLSAR